MASSSHSTESSKGYDHQFVDPIPDDLLCLICLSVARDPQQVTCCGKVYCNSCLEDHKSHSQTRIRRPLCPQCRKKFNIFADKRSNRNILALKTRCDNTINGCEWIGELCTLDDHLSHCGYTFVPCPNECKESGNVLCKDMEEHTKVCPRRPYKCPHCEESGEYQEVSTEHLEVCPKKEVQCPNRGCDQEIQRCKISTHRQECMFEKVPCKYASIGCRIEFLRKDLGEHETDSQRHLSLALDTIHQQENRLAMMQSKYDDVITKLSSLEAYIQINESQLHRIPVSLRLLQSLVFSDHESDPEFTADYHYHHDLSVTPTQLQTYRFKFVDFERHKSSNDIEHSPPYYTSPGGYRMCIRVYANGGGDGKSTHVSVFAFLMHGANDDHLPWPFTGRVTFELLNQLEDKNHRSGEITFPPDSDASKQVINQERSSTGYGLPCFIRHSALGYNSAKCYQYLKNDCLYFRIKTSANNTTKPWLVP